MGGKYEIIGMCYPCSDVAELHEFTNSWWKARKLYRKAKKMFFSAFIIRNEKNKDVVEDYETGKLIKREKEVK